MIWGRIKKKIGRVLVLQREEASENGVATSIDPFTLEMNSKPEAGELERDRVEY